MYHHMTYRLKYLNLNNNEMYTIPRLKLLGTNHLRPHSKSTPTHSSNHDRTKGESTDLTAVNTMQAPSLQGRDSEESRGGVSQRVGAPESTQDSPVRRDSEQEEAEKRLPILLRTASAPVSPIAQHSSCADSRVDYKIFRNRTKSLCLPSEQSSGGARPIASSMSTGSIPMGTSDANRSGLVSIPDSIFNPINPVTSSVVGCSVPIPGSNLDEPPMSNAADRGGDTKGTSVQFEEWSPTQIVEEGSEGEANLLPFPVLETLSLVNNLVSLYLN